jgi:ATP-binding cassette subfamily B protein RaxB
LPADAGRSFLQTQPNSCGPAALAYLLSYLGLDARESDFLQAATLGPAGASMADLAGLARRLGLQAWGERQNYAALHETTKPAIAHVGGDHFVVVLASDAASVDLFDPRRGYVRLARAAFERVWGGNVLVVRFPPLDGETK